MQRIDYSKYIVPQRLENENGPAVMLHKEDLDTTDLIYLLSSKEFRE